MTLSLALNPRGHAVIRIAGLNGNRPLQISIWNTNPGQKLTNDEILAATDAFVSGLQIQEGVRLELICPRPEKSSTSQPSSSAPAPAPAGGSTSAGSDQALNLLLSIVTSPLDSNSRRCAVLQMSQGGFSRAIAALEHRGFVQTFAWGRFRFLAFTDEGREYLETQHATKVAAFPGHGGVEHRLAAQLVRFIFERRGYRARVEHPIGASAKLVDVFAERGGERVGVEIAMGSSDEESNFVKDMASGVLSRLVFVFPDGKTLERWRTRFEAHPGIRPNLGRAELNLLTILLKELPK